MSSRGSSGQATVEFILVAAVLLAMVAVLAVLLVSVREQGGRVVELVAADSP